MTLWANKGRDLRLIPADLLQVTRAIRGGKLLGVGNDSTPSPFPAESPEVFLTVEPWGLAHSRETFIQRVAEVDAGNLGRPCKTRDQVRIEEHRAGIKSCPSGYFSRLLQEAGLADAHEPAADAAEDGGVLQPHRYPATPAPEGCVYVNQLDRPSEGVRSALGVNGGGGLIHGDLTDRPGGVKCRVCIERFQEHYAPSPLT